jgi:hypothetical protein
MLIGIAFADRREVGRDGHEPADLTQARHVERNARNIAGDILL